MAEAERVQPAVSQEADGLDHEIAMLRARLRSAFAQQRGDMAALMRGVNALVRAVSARYKLTPGQSRQLAKSIEAAFRELSEEIG